ncbi:hypothetical protein RHMOL_Rhmol03G0174500 [Rhododendron molle]|uniref:Uncharacterized protein n=1 Tax=Rhododendron molle TaxID=49168 RepID=A0ACC0PFS7_RHOML|nr:hypothetical protein RHMOL_Rhmol03G0174500 [Rhododendron molle]
MISELGKKLENGLSFGVIGRLIELSTVWQIFVLIEILFFKRDVYRLLWKFWFQNM